MASPLNGKLLSNSMNNASSYNWYSNANRFDSSFTSSKMCSPFLFESLFFSGTSFNFPLWYWCCSCCCCCCSCLHVGKMPRYSTVRTKCTIYRWRLNGVSFSCEFVHVEKVNLMFFRLFAVLACCTNSML